MVIAPATTAGYKDFICPRPLFAACATTRTAAPWWTWNFRSVRWTGAWSKAVSSLLNAHRKAPPRAWISLPWMASAAGRRGCCPGGSGLPGVRPAGLCPLRGRGRGGKRRRTPRKATMPPARARSRPSRTASPMIATPAARRATTGSSPAPRRRFCRRSCAREACRRRSVTGWRPGIWWVTWGIRATHPSRACTSTRCAVGRTRRLPCRAGAIRQPCGSAGGCCRATVADAAERRAATATRTPVPGEEGRAVGGSAATV